MKAIILAAGQGTRLKPLTDSMPKVMVTVGGKPLLEHNLEKLAPYVDEFIIVIKYKKETIVEYFGNSFENIPIRYHEQGEEKWTGAAIRWIKADWDIVIAYADAIIAKEDIDRVMQCEDFAVLVKKVPNPEKYGIFTLDENRYITSLIEKPQTYIGNTANFSFFKVQSDILEMVEKVELSPRGEIEITDAIRMFFAKYPMRWIHIEHDIIDVTTVEDLEKANTLWNKKHGK
jgi:UDP-N-acetylglucosamine diphosphorylase / glucose-1-phosphate thymidylyltransferase / UDP-N-acetylgalactosamine diphosphorylase / glucosamine-1-phosphate N-acetyltransferase / galactosamine-1-phosphate N-acetyltransferase